MIKVLKKMARYSVMAIVTAAILLGSFTGIGSLKAADQVWNGSVDTTWYDPAGSEFVLTTPEQLAGVATIVNGKDYVNNQPLANLKDKNGASVVQSNLYGKTIKLASDMYLNNAVSDSPTALDTSARQWTSIGGGLAGSEYAAGFAGTLDGQGHMIYNMYIFETAVWTQYDGRNRGLVGIADKGATIRNLGITGTLRGARSLGGIVGKTGEFGEGEQVLIENCINKVNVYGTDSKGWGGIVGSGWNIAEIRNCINAGQVRSVSGTTNYPAGGIAGEIEIKITNCYNIGQITGPANYAGAIAATAKKGTKPGVQGTVSNSFWLEGSASGGGVAFTEAGLPAHTVTMKTSEQMKTPEFLTELNNGGDAFVMDTKNVLGGYPVLSWMVPNDAPVAKNPVPVQGLIAGENVSFTAADIAIDGDGDTLTITKIETPPASATATATLLDGVVTITGVAKGDTALAVVVSDGKDEITIPVTVKVSAVNSAPVAKNPVPTQSLFEGTSNTFSASDIATDVDEQPLTITDIVVAGDTSKATLALNDGVVTITGIVYGNTSATVRVSDGKATVDVVVPIEIKEITELPAVSPSSLTMNAGEIKTINVQLGLGSDGATSATIASIDENTAKVDVATVSASGTDIKVQGIASGTTDITITWVGGTQDGLTVTVPVTVNAIPYTTVDVSKDTSLTVRPFSVYLSAVESLNESQIIDLAQASAKVLSTGGALNVSVASHNVEGAIGNYVATITANGVTRIVEIEVIADPEPQYIIYANDFSILPSEAATLTEEKVIELSGARVEEITVMRAFAAAAAPVISVDAAELAAINGATAPGTYPLTLKVLNTTKVLTITLASSNNNGGGQTPTAGGSGTQSGSTVNAGTQVNSSMPKTGNMGIMLLGGNILATGIVIAGVMAKRRNQR